MKPKSNYVDQPEKDRCQTPEYALDPLIPYIKRFDIIWEPACGEGYLVEALKQLDHRVIASDLDGEYSSQDFFAYDLQKHWDCIVTNPPFSLKYPWFARCCALGKPFALLMPIDVFGAQQGQDLIINYGVEIILLNQRVDFKMPNKGWKGSGAQFSVAWFTSGLNIGQQITYGDIKQGKAIFKEQLEENGYDL